MSRLSSAFTISALFLAGYANAQTYSATYLPSNVPPTTEEGQAGTNQCGTGLNQTSECQNAYINSLTDFCIFAPPNPGPDSTIGNTERIEVAWCTKNGTGTRLIPDGAITGAHFVQTPDFVQVTGIGNLTLINVPVGPDGGGELDPHGADGNGNPIGGLVFSTAFGPLQQLHEWTNFLSDSEFCFRACKPGPMAPTFCQHIYDVMGCAWNMPGNYGSGFDQCAADSGEPMGVYGTSTFFQGQPATPAAHPVPASSSCTTSSTIANGFLISGTAIAPPGATSSGASSAVSSVPSSGSGAGGSLTPSFTSSASSQSVSGSGASGSAKTPAPTSSGASPANTSSSAATRAAFTDGSERLILTVGSAVIGSMFGALFVL
ncbi:hypothetical protein BDZ97DRAFT_1662743 [Flammula alnicola]|nr:hypothetical protein BDZ97DRAFT_1662743 [Flammula alnicola]